MADEYPVEQQTKKHAADTSAGPVQFSSADPRDEGRLRYFLNQLAKLCQLRGDLIPKAQDALLKEYLLTQRDRRHLQKLSHTYALRAEEAANRGNAKLALLERLEAWRKMPRDLSLLLDLVEAYHKPLQRSATALQEEEAQQAEELAGKAPDSKESKESKESKDTGDTKRTGDTRDTGAEKNASSKNKQKQAIAARELFQLNRFQYHRSILSYLKKAVELNIGLGAEVKAEDAARLASLKLDHPQVKWERYAQKIRTLNGRAQRRWPWFLLALLLLASTAVLLFFRPWLRETAAIANTSQAQQQEEPEPDSPFLSEAVPVVWEIPQEQDQSFIRVIQRSRHLRLAEFYAYEVQGHLLIKPNSTASSSLAQPFPSFDLDLGYQHGKELLHKTLHFGTGSAASSTDQAALREGDTLLFREVFHLSKSPTSRDKLEARLVITGEPPNTTDQNSPLEDLQLPSIDANGRIVPNLSLGLRQLVQRSDGSRTRMLGYDLAIQNSSTEPLQKFILQLRWLKKEALKALPKENSVAGPEASLNSSSNSSSSSSLSSQKTPKPLLEKRFPIIQASGPYLPGQSRTVRRLWVHVPENLARSLPQSALDVRILEHQLPLSPTP